MDVMPGPWRLNWKQLIYVLKLIQQYVIIGNLDVVILEVFSVHNSMDKGS